jgi:hypothetical protein
VGDNISIACIEIKAGYQKIYSSRKFALVYPLGHDIDTAKNTAYSTAAIIMMK